MAPFRWPSIKHDIALAKEVVSNAPEKAAEWNTIAANLSEAFSTDETKVEVKGRGCRERMERLIEKHKKKESMALKRSGTEEDYSELSQLCEDIWTYRRDMQVIKEQEMATKKKKEEENKNKGEEMRRSALEGLSKRRCLSDSNALGSSSDDEHSESDDGESTCSSIASNSKGGRKKTKKRASKLTAIDMLANKYRQKADLKERELEIRKQELEFQRKKFDVDAEERRVKFELDSEERKVMLALLRDKLSE